MTCFHPLKAFPIGYTDKNKIKYKITSYDIDHVEYYDKKWHNSTIKGTSKYCETAVYDFEEIPCGKCVGCRLDYSRQWADRCLLEMKEHEHNVFVTLTYDDSHLPTNTYVDKDSGTVNSIGTLVKRDFQLFMKRLRKAVDPQKIRFFACGEYGDHTLRPHYHAIIFGLKLDDLVFYKHSRGFNYYNSPLLQSCWCEEGFRKKGDPPLPSLGFVVVADANWQTAAYVARYIMKKQKGQDAKIYEDYNFSPEFVLMSRKPGLGRNFFDANVEKIFSEDKIFLPTAEGSRAISPNKYFKRLFADLYDDESFLRKEMNKEFAASTEYVLSEFATSKPHLERLLSEEENLLCRVKSLKREEF